MATVTGHLTALDSCSIIKEGDSNYKEALTAIIHAQKQFAQIKTETYAKIIN